MILLLEWSGGGSRRLGASRNDEGGGPSGYFGSTAIKQSNSCGNTQGSIHAGGCMRIDRRRREPLHQCLESSPGGAQQVSVWSPVECRRWQLKALPRDLQRFSNDVIAIRPLVPRGAPRRRGRDWRRNIMPATWRGPVSKSLWASRSRVSATN